MYLAIRVDKFDLQRYRCAVQVDDKIHKNIILINKINNKLGID